MAFEMFAGLVALLALVYVVIMKFTQEKLIDKAAMKSMQEESNALNREFEEARKSGNKKRMDDIMQKQIDFMPRMNAVMFNQFKLMFVMLGILFGFVWILGYLDPTTKDDIKISLHDDGTGCDLAAGDGIYTYCFDATGTDYGKWTATANMFSPDGANKGSNETYFSYGPGKADDSYIEKAKGEDLIVSADKESYKPGERVTITAVPAAMTKGSSFIIHLSDPEKLDIARVDLAISNGTYFRIDLPFTIPLFGLQPDVRRIYQPYTWFIFISIALNLCIALGTFLMKPKGAGGMEKGK